MIPSHIGLRKYVRYYNIVFPERNTFLEHYTIMPNACGTLSLAFNGDKLIAELWGASVAPVLLGLEPNTYSFLLLIQLSPVGLYQITGQYQGAFAGKRLMLSEIDHRLFQSLHHAFETSKTLEDLKNACDRILYKRMERQVVSETLILASTAIAESHGQMQVNEVAQKAGYSEKQLNRLFQMQIGMGIKNFARLSRLNYVLKHLETSSDSFAVLSQRAGYFDQAHFDKDFKGLCGFSPKEYVKIMSDFYYDELESV